MPTYDYVCTSCGHEVEVMHSVHAEGPSGCPKCGARMRKAIVPLAVHFKGGGWARKEKGSGKSAKTGTKEPGSSGASDAGSGSSGSGEPSGEKAREKAREKAWGPSGDKAGEKTGEPSRDTAPKGAD